MSTNLSEGQSPLHHSLHPTITRYTSGPVISSYGMDFWEACLLLKEDSQPQIGISQLLIFVNILYLLIGKVVVELLNT